MVLYFFLFYIFLFGQFNFFQNLFKPEINICLEENLNRGQFQIKGKNNKIENYPTFYDKEDIKGKVILSINTKDFEHKNIKILLQGLILERKSLINSKTTEFLHSEIILEKPGVFKEENLIYEFEFKNVEKKYETYRGELITVKYLVIFIIETKLRNMKYEKEFVVINPINEKMLNKEQKLRYKIENDKIKFLIDIPFKNIDFKGVIPGIITIKKLNNHKIDSIMIQIIKRENINSSEKEKLHKSITIGTFEVLDGEIIEKEKIPFRIFLSSYSLTPSYFNLEKLYSINYYMAIIISDNEGNKFSDVKEINLFRIIPEKKIESKYSDFVTANLNYELNKSENYFYGTDAEES